MSKSLLQPQELQERIAAFDRWHYRFEFDDGVSTPVPDRGRVNRHEQRRRYFFEALLRVTGGSLRGRRVLDLGCNAGFWSLHAIEAGADFVLGVDARQVHIDQAKLVFEAKGVDPDRYRFERGNVFGHELGERFDVVLCLGLMEHVARPVELFELMTGVGAELIVIDTALSRARSSCFEVSSLDEPRDVVDCSMVLVPTRQAVIELAGQFGFKAVPLARNVTDYAGMDDYRRGRRLAFVCAKGVALDALPREEEPSDAPWASAVDLARRGWQGLGR
jgi:tRNA (mo5U34)-methyltransferase